MRIMITGGSGYLGTEVTAALVAEGHQVLGLVRSDASARTITALGAEPLYGDLRELRPIVEEAARCDAFLHLAQDRGPDRYRTDSRLIEALTERRGSENRLRHLVYTSTLFVLGNVTGDAASEDSPPDPPPFVEARAAVEQQTLVASHPSLTTTVIRPGMVYGGGTGGTVSELFRSAQEDGTASYVGDGENRWSLVHRFDVAAMYVAVLRERAAGILHAVDGHPMPVREIAVLASQAAGRGDATGTIPLDEARRVLGEFADALVLDQPAVTVRAGELGWSPSWPPFNESASAAYREWKRSTDAA